jgi:hypothetical protein
MYLYHNGMAQLKVKKKLDNLYYSTAHVCHRIQTAFPHFHKLRDLKAVRGNVAGR